MIYTSIIALRVSTVYEPKTYYIRFMRIQFSYCLPITILCIIPVHLYTNSHAYIEQHYNRYNITYLSILSIQLKDINFL